MFHLIALDIAGTTIDDHGAVYDALRTAVEETGASVAAEDLQTWMGTDKVTAISALMRLGGLEPDEATVAAAFERFRVVLAESYATHPPQIIPGVAEAIARLRGDGVKVALTTGFSDDVVEPLLASVGWTVPQHLDAVVTTSDVPAGRPAPYMIHRAMAATGVHDVRTVLAAGDTVVDLQAARNAGAYAVGVLTGLTPRAALEGADHDAIADSVADLPTLIAGLA
ncbi:phosphonatase-like hydrolase [Microbacterium sp. W1N]|uniref:phosphonatase-like hydrolase n=1 Tax=Microbacterium festucae TaxID=2977531 RepID=UPI0021BE2C24|nr:phosphonatase-like hydrolase [Microbacterium festucae]MCT9820496.1 phosphonatase-like hydrolase [Microbacterium festucae]